MFGVDMEHFCLATLYYDNGTSKVSRILESPDARNIAWTAGPSAKALGYFRAVRFADCDSNYTDDYAMTSAFFQHPFRSLCAFVKLTSTMLPSPSLKPFQFSSVRL